MPVFSKRFKAQPGDYGAEFIILQTGSQATITAAAVQQYAMGAINDKDDTDKTRAHQGFIDELVLVAMLSPTGSSGILVNVKKYDAAAGAVRSLVSNFDMKTLVSQKAERLPFDAGVTDAQRTMQKGDQLYCEVNAGGTVTVQPIFNLTAFIALLK